MEVKETLIEGRKIIEYLGNDGTVVGTMVVPVGAEPVDTGDNSKPSLEEQVTQLQQDNTTVLMALADIYSLLEQENKGGTT